MLYYTFYKFYTGKQHGFSLKIVTFFYVPLSFSGQTFVMKS